MVASEANQPHERACGDVSSAIFEKPAGIVGKASGRRGVLAPLAGALLALLALLATTLAGAALGWLAPVDLSAPGQSASAAQVAVDPQGNAVAVWQRSNGTNLVVQATVRLADGVWQAPVDLSVAGEDASAAQVAVDRQGNAVAVWQRSNGTNLVVQGAVRPAGGTWQAPVDLSAAGQEAQGAQVAVDPRGNAVAVWHRSSDTNDIVQAAARPAGGAWQAPIDVSPAGENASNARVAVDRHGNAVAVWQRFDETNFIVQGAVRTGEAWQAAVDLSAAGVDALVPQVAVDPDGNAAAVWQSTDGMTDVVQGAVRPARGSWQEPANLSAAGHEGFDPQVTVDPRGTAVAVWQGANDTNDVVQGAVRPAGGAWQAPVDLSAAGQDAQAPQVAVDPRGNAVAVWPRFDDDNMIVQGAVRPAGGAWEGAVALSAAGQDGQAPQVAVDAQGNAVAVWQRSNGTDTIVQGLGVNVLSADVRAGATTGGSAPKIAIAPPSSPLAREAGLRLSPSRFRAARSGPTVRSASVRTGTRVTYSLAGAARVRFTVQRAGRGRTVGGRCFKATGSNRKGKSCARFVPVRGSFARIRPAGADRFRFTGRVAGRTLKPGSYRFVATPTANGRAGTPVGARFQILRRLRARGR